MLSLTNATESAVAVFLAFGCDRVPQAMRNNFHACDSKRAMLRAESLPDSRAETNGDAILQ